MPGVLLFCTADDAKTFVPKVLSIDEENWPFFLVESRQSPAHGEEFKETLKDGETFETDFIGASMEDCGSWALQQQDKNNMIEQDVIAIVDKRSAMDQTITLAVYPRDVVSQYLGEDQKPNAWYEFRVPFLKAQEIRAIPYADADETYGVYFGRKDELTDDHGVFNVDKALELILQGEGFTAIEDGA